MVHPRRPSVSSPLGWSDERPSLPEPRDHGPWVAGIAARELWGLLWRACPTSPEMSFLYHAFSPPPSHPSPRPSRHLPASFRPCVHPSIHHSSSIRPPVRPSSRPLFIHHPLPTYSLFPPFLPLPPLSPPEAKSLSTSRWPIEEATEAAALKALTAERPAAGHILAGVVRTRVRARA